MIRKVYYTLLGLRRYVLMDLKPIRPPYYPAAVYIEPTNRCVLQCRYCLHEAMVRPQGFMDFDLYKKIVSDIAGKVLQVDLFAQGEPLLHKDIFEMVRYAHDRGLRTSLNTNGTLLTRERMQGLIDAGLSNLYVSFDCGTKDLWMEYKKGSAKQYEQAHQNVLNAIEMAGAAGHPRLRMGILRYRDNKDYVADFVSHWTAAVGSAGEVCVQDLINMWGQNDSDPSMAWFREIQAEIKSDNVPDRSLPVCFSPWTNCVVYWDGRVGACSYDSQAKTVVGDTNSESLLDIWKGEKFAQWRKWCVDRVFDETGHQGAICKSCSLLYSPCDSLPLSFSGQLRLRWDRLLARLAGQKQDAVGLDELYRYDFRKRRFAARPAVHH